MCLQYTIFAIFEFFITKQNTASHYRLNFRPEQWHLLLLPNNYQHATMAEWIIAIEMTHVSKLSQSYWNVYNILKISGLIANVCTIMLIVSDFQEPIKCFNRLYLVANLLSKITKFTFTLNRCLNINFSH